MATKTLRIVRPGRYGTRELRADDTYEATAPEARLYLKLGWMAEKVEAEAVEAPKPKAPPRKRAPARKKAAPKK